IEVHFTFGDITGWIITDPYGKPLFTFDLPDKLFQLYSDEGKLSRSRAVDLKEDYFANFTALYLQNGQIRVFNFRLREGWVEEIRENLRQYNIRFPSPFKKENVKQTVLYTTDMN